MGLNGARGEFVGLASYLCLLKRREPLPADQGCNLALLGVPDLANPLRQGFWGSSMQQPKPGFNHLFPVLIKAVGVQIQGVGLWGNTSVPEHAQTT